MKLHLSAWAIASICVACAAANGPPPPPTGASLSETDKSLTGCKGKAATSIPSDGVYVITTFGGASESQQMSCGSHTQNGSWYYAASRQRYGCGSKIQIQGGGKCVVAQTDDYGPDVCVENAAGRAIIDVSPLVAQELFGVSGFGWSDNQTVTVTQVGSDAALGPCSGTGSDPGTGGTGNDPGTGGSDPGVGGSGTGGDPGMGGGSGGGAQCYCDAQCQDYGDCCADCGTPGTGGSGSGTGGSGGGQCYCDAQCADYGDCCPECPNGSGGSGSGSGSGYCGDGSCDIAGGEDCSTCIEDCDPSGGCY